ncbi:MAG: RluA family pseudouridine synthase [Candidatus Muiribacteriota bacterium]
MYKTVFEDDKILIINKSHNIPVVKDGKDIGRPYLLKLLREKYNRRIYMIHRLDAGTGGLMIWAKKRKYQKKISNLFENHSVNKEYLAIVKGTINKAVSVFAPISKKNYHGKYKVDFENGRNAQTTIYPERNYDKYALVKVKLFTGRSHQIRVHLKHIKHPLLFDYQYNLSTKWNEKRLTLMCYKLGFKYQGKFREFSIEPTDYLNRFL